MNITVYLGASEGNAPCLIERVEELGTWIGSSGHALIYGGSKSGLMGIIADSTLKAGGEVTGVEPKFFIENEFQHDGLTKLIVNQGYDGAQKQNDFVGRSLYCLPWWHGNIGGDCRGDVEGVFETTGCTLHSL